MHISDGLRAYGIDRKAVIVVMVLPFLLVSLNCVEASPEKDLAFPSHVSLGDSVLIAGAFQYLDVTLPTEHEKICIIAFNGDTEPKPQDRSENNYYRWEYDNGAWNDTSGYDISYIDSSQCSKQNTTYLFYLRTSQKVNPGSWTIKVLVDDIEASSISFQVVIGDFCLFFSTIIGVFEPTMKQKNLLSEDELRCCYQQKKQEVSEANIERFVDSVLKKHTIESNKDDSKRKTRDLYHPSDDFESTQEPIRTAISLYPRTKLKEITNEKTNTLFFWRTQTGGDSFCSYRSEGLKRFFIILVLTLLLTASIVPMVVLMGRNENTCDITIINNHSYPLIGGNWTVLFTMVGCADLTITAVNRTSWGNSDPDADLKFLHVDNGNKTVDCYWMNDSVYIPNFSSNVTCSEISQVLTPGVHVLMFQFGDDIAFAYNLASENWLQTSTSDFNNGTKTNINVNSGSFHLQERYYLRNFTRINNEGFEGSWPPVDWSEVPTTSNWNAENYEVYEGSYSADFDGAGGAGGASGNLLSPSMNCAGSNVTAIYVKFWGYSDAADNGEYFLDYYDGSTWDQITRLDDFGQDVWAQYSQKVTDSQYFKSNFQIRWRVVGLNNNEHVYVDLVNVTVERNESGYHSAGSLLSAVHDTARNMPDYNNIHVGNTAPSGTTITTWVRAAGTQANLSTATWYSTINQVPDKRWVQWRINLTGNTYLTPTINDVNLTWTYDNEYPISSVNTLMPYWQKTTPFQISVTASDNGTGIKEVALYCNYSANNVSGWSGWSRYGTNDTTSPYTWSFTPPQGDGYYRFYSRAIDGELNNEAAPSTPGFDASCGVDTVKPSSHLSEIIPYWYIEPDRDVIINCSSASDSLSGLQNILLYYRYRVDNGSSWGSWQLFSSDTAAPWYWIFNFPKAKGFYQFYSIAVDNAGNAENPPTAPDNDTDCAYNSTKPYSEVNAISPYWHSTSLTITAQATDFNGSGLLNVTLYYYYSSNNNTWSTSYLFGVDTDPWNANSWVFTFPNGSGYYRFYSLAIDNDTNVEYFTGNDTLGGYDVVQPSSQVYQISTYWHSTSENPLLITVTNTSDSLSGVKNVTLSYRYRADNTSSWNAAVPFSSDENAPWSWNFTFPNGNGHYRFYSLATDHAGTREDPPTSPEYDTQCGYDTSKPSSQVAVISPYEVTVSPFLISATASDDTKNVTIWYYYSPQNSSWWNPNWHYRKQLNISAKNGGYQMRIIIGNTSGGNVTCNGHTRSNFGDIRFVSYSDNSTALSYWLKNYTAGAQATFWVNNSRNDTSIWLYYGNSNALTTSSGDSTFYFFDDFSNGLSKWVMDSWNTDSILINQSQGNPSPALKHLPDNSIPANRTYQDTRIRTAYKILNGIIEYDVYLAGTPRIIHQFGWRVNSLSWTNGYCWRVQNSAADGGFFEFSAPSTWTQFGAAFPLISTSTWYHVKINVSSATYSAKITPSAPAGDSARSATDSTKTTADYLISHVHGVSMNSGNYALVDNVFVRKYWATPPTWGSAGAEQSGYGEWNNASNPDPSPSWGWNFDFPGSFGYYWFYSVAVDVNGDKEDPPNSADARCRYEMPIAPVINSYDLRNESGSKLNNATGLLDVNSEYYFTINVTAKFGWFYIDYIDIIAWYDQGSETSLYNQTTGGNLNMYLRYENVTGNASFRILWPKYEVQLVTSNCTQTIVNNSTRIIKISFKPLNQTRWACSNNTWDTTKNTTNDPFSWNFNITAIDTSGLKAWKNDEYGIYKFALLLPDKNWVDVRAPPGYNATTNIVNITYCSNYNYNISIYFEENLTNVSSGDIIPIANNVYICANADMDDDITTDMMFNGIQATNAIDIINTSGIFHKNNTSQYVHVQFNVFIPFGTIQGEYTAHVATKIKFKER
ncbi:MAG TPA: DUF2341 domain-containing protein [Candidatus Thermoplasmatota archaeon]|nr:DUF2341 domain-containing protein [Candidatus Thermoplasmatota archaeon]